MTMLSAVATIRRLAMPGLLGAIILFSAQGVEARPQQVTPRVFPPSSTPYGHTYSEWSAIFWQTLLENPFDPEAPTIGQSGHVVFLNSPAGPASVYEHAVPSGTAILLTVGTAAFWVPDDFPEGTPIEVLRETAAYVVDLVTTAECSVDGVPVNDVWGYRTISPVFYGYLNPINPWGYPEHPYGPAVADGFWIMLAPFHVGDHEIYFHSIVTDPDTGQVLFEAEATHSVTVTPDHPGIAGDPLAIEPVTWGAIKAAYR